MQVEISSVAAPRYAERFLEFMEKEVILDEADMERKYRAKAGNRVRSATAAGMIRISLVHRIFILICALDRD